MAIVRFLTGTGLGSTAIQWWTSSPYSHVEFWTPNGYLGARYDGGVQVRPFDYTNFVAEEFREYVLPVDAEAKLFSWLAQQIGKDYDWLAILAFPVHRDWKSEDDWFCSELVAAAFTAAGFPILNPATKVSKITPRDVALSMLLAPCAKPSATSP